MCQRDLTGCYNYFGRHNAKRGYKVLARMPIGWRSVVFTALWPEDKAVTAVSVPVPGHPIGISAFKALAPACDAYVYLGEDYGFEDLVVVQLFLWGSVLDVYEEMGAGALGWSAQFAQVIEEVEQDVVLGVLEKRATEAALRAKAVAGLISAECPQRGC